jgi:hypothetical protein
VTSEVPTSFAGLKASMKFDSEISNSFLWSRVRSVVEVVQIGLDDLDVDC